MKKILLLTVLFFATNAVLAETAMEQAFKIYKGKENLTFSAERGKKMWNDKVKAKDGKMRDCNSCHGSDFTKSGKHVRTGKEIKPMSQKVNKERYTELKKIKKWFKRNCKWMYARECTNQEKGDFLLFLSQQ